MHTIIEEKQPHAVMRMRFLDHVDGFSEQGVTRGRDKLCETVAAAAEGDILSCLKDSSVMLFDG